MQMIEIFLVDLVSLVQFISVVNEMNEKKQIDQKMFSIGYNERNDRAR
jgi:hypothetical protein